MIEPFDTAAATTLVDDGFVPGTQIAVEADASVEVESLAGQALQNVDVAPPGHAIRVAWSAVPDATAAEVDSASLRITPIPVEQPLGQLLVTASGPHREIAIPPGKRVRSLTLQGLGSSEVSLLSSADLGAAGLRLVVTMPDGSGGWSPPLFSVPSVPARGLLPPALTGATYENKVLRLPDLAAARIRLTLVRGEFPENFAPEENMSLGSVTAVAAVPPRDLELVDSQGTVVWGFPGEFLPQAPAAEVDLRFALEQVLNAALAADQPLDVTFRLRGAAPGRVALAFAGARGALVRSFPGVSRSKLEGDAVPLDLGGDLASELPSSATADLTVRYEGLRILETVSDSVPVAGALAGSVVTDQPVIRAFPPAALIGRSPARVGLIGRAPVECELSVQMVDMSTGIPGPTVGPPGVIEREASATIATVWVDLPRIDPPTVPVGLSVRANRGRFLWANGPDPLLRLAVRDPDPGGRPLRLGGQQILAVDAGETHLPAKDLPTVEFQTTAPTWESDLFLTVDLSDLVLRYRR